MSFTLSVTDVYIFVHERQQQHLDEHSVIFVLYFKIQNESHVLWVV